MSERPAMQTRDEAAALIKKVLSFSRADQAEVTLDGGTATHLRFARNTPSTSGSESGPTLTVASSFGRRSGAYSVNQLDDETLSQAVARSEEIARLAPEDPEHMPGLDAQQYREVAAYFESTATEGATRMASGAAACIEAARRRELVAAGFTRTAAEYEAVGNSRGLYAYHRSTSASFSATLRTPDGTGSGWAGRVARKIEDLDYAGASTIAAEKSVASKKPRKLEPGKYVTILEPSSVAELLGLMVFDMDTRRADEGRSFFSAQAGKGAKGAASGGTRLGDRLFGKEVDIRSDPTDARVPSRPWNDEGLPQSPRAWIDHGRVSSLACDRFWATQKKVEPVPFPTNLIMAGGRGTVADLIKSTKRGVLVTSFWYIRELDPQTLMHTGLTRDGVFWIENGEIAYPVNNFRWNESPVSVFKHIDAMSAAQVLPGRNDTQPFTVVPALRLSTFNFASTSDAI